MPEEIYIEPEDDIQKVVARLDEHPHESINLIVPAGARILQNIVDAYLVRDAAEANSQEVTIVTNDIMGRVFAERAGIKVVNAVSAAGMPVATEATARLRDIVPQKARSQSKRGAKPLKTKPANPAPKSGATARFFRFYKEGNRELEDLKDLRAKQKGRGRFGFKISAPKIIVVVLVLAVLLAGFVFGKVLPEAKVTVYPVREPTNFNTEILVDKGSSEIDQERGVLPGELLISNHEASDEFIATGVENVSSKARGSIIVFNEFSSKSQTFVPSRFEAEDGKIFWTTKTITVPGALIEGGNTTPGRIEVEVIAAEAGESYNIGPTEFKMPALKGTERYGKIYARSEKPMEGGKIGEATVVTKADFENALATLRSKIGLSLEGFRNNLPGEFSFWSEAYNEEVVEESSNKKVGEPAERFTAKIKVTARAVVFKKNDLDKILNDEINSRLARDKTVLPGSKEITFLKPPVVDYQKGTIFASLAIRADVIENLNIDAFRRSILKKNKTEIKEILPTFGGIERVEVKLWPFWVRRVPAKAERVGINIFGTDSTSR